MKDITNQLKVTPRLGAVITKAGETIFAGFDQKLSSIFIFDSHSTNGKGACAYQIKSIKRKKRKGK
jgi:hypothetical protein